MMLRNFLGLSNQLLCKNYCIPQKDVNIFQTLLHTKETSTYNFVHNASKFVFFIFKKQNFTLTYLSQTISLFEKKNFLEVFHSEKSYSQLPYTKEIFK